VAIVGASLTLILGGQVHSDTIRIIDATSSLSKPYGELSSGSIIGYSDNFTNWTLSSSNAQVESSQGSLVISGVFQGVSRWTAVNLFKTASVNITAFPILNAEVNLTEGVNYGIRFFSQYANGTTYNVSWEGSPLDHRPGSGYESLRVNMQREALLATGHPVTAITEMELYVEDPPNSPRSFKFTLSNLSFEDDSIEQVSQNWTRL
jgi:hypothetical protein